MVLEVNENKKIDIKRYQSQLLTILNVYVDLCNKYKLKYYLNAGTLLGAVRDQGFIPWDDDIDVCMPRSDYEKFLKYAVTELPSSMRAVWFESQDHQEHPQYYCQIQDLRIPIIQKIAATPKETYAWIDVFPLDGMPQSPLLRLIHSFRLIYRRSRMQMSMFDINVNLKRKNRPFYEKFIIWLVMKTGLFKSSNPYTMMEKMDKALKLYPEQKSKLWINFMGAYKLKETFPSGVYGKGTLLTFENQKYTGPLDPNTILTKLYGNYKIPASPDVLHAEHYLYYR